MPDASPFDHPEEVTCFVHRRIVEEGRPILLFARSETDDVYHALTGEEVDEAGVDDVKRVTLLELFAIDPSVGELYDLEPGWWALRDSPDGEWYREPMPDEGEDDE